jgi:hypothetical protein
MLEILAYLMFLIFSDYRNGLFGVIVEEKFLPRKGWRIIVF